MDSIEAIDSRDFGPLFVGGFDADVDDDEDDTLWGGQKLDGYCRVS